jgi:NACalpha-BTF3-like transcription factor
MAFFKPQMLGTAVLRDLQIAMRKDLRAAVKRTGTRDVKFLLAKDVKLADGKKACVFVVAALPDEVKIWHEALKSRKPAAFAEGTCAFEQDEDRTTRILLKRISGASRQVAIKTAGAALRGDPAFVVHDATDQDAQREAQENEAEENETSQSEANAVRPLQVRPADIKRLAAEIGVPEADVRRELQAHGGEIARQLEAFMNEVREEIGLR